MPSVRVDASGDTFRRTATLPTNDPLTLMGRFKLVNDRNAVGSLMNVNDGTGNGLGVRVNTDGTTLQCVTYVATVTNTVSGTNLNIGQVYHVARVRNGSVQQVWLNGVLDSSESRAVSFTTSQLEFLNNAAVEWIDGNGTDFRVFTAAMNQTQIVAEMNSRDPVAIESLWAHYRTLPGSPDRARDSSGNGRDLTEGGTLTDEDGAPLSSFNRRFIVLLPPVTQPGRPNADNADGNWTNEAGSTTNLYASIDEAGANDSDYIQSGLNPASDLVQLGLPALSDPASSNNHVVRYRYKRGVVTSGQINLTVRLKQNTTTIASWTHNNISDSYVTAEQVLSGGEADSITNYGDLRLEFEATQV